jgi:hypothetical protein
MELTNKSTTKAKQNSYMLLSVYHQNFRGLKHNIDELTCSLMAKELHPYFRGITEHYLSEQKLLLINDKRYHLVSNLSCINNTDGDVCIYIRSDTIQNTSKKKSLNFLKRKSLKHVLLRLLLKNV